METGGSGRRDLRLPLFACSSNVQVLMCGRASQPDVTGRRGKQCNGAPAVRRLRPVGRGLEGYQMRRESRQADSRIEVNTRRCGASQLVRAGILPRGRSVRVGATGGRGQCLQLVRPEGRTRKTVGTKPSYRRTAPGEPGRRRVVRALGGAGRREHAVRWATRRRTRCSVIGICAARWTRGPCVRRVSSVIGQLRGCSQGQSRRRGRAPSESQAPSIAPVACGSDFCVVARPSAGPSARC